MLGADTALGLLRTSNQQLTDQFANALLKLKRGRSALVLTGRSSKSLSLVAAGLAHLAADRTDTTSRRVLVLKGRCLAGGEDIRRYHQDARSTFLIVENIELLRTSRVNSIYSALDRFARLGGVLVATSTDGGGEIETPRGWDSIDVPDLSQRKSDVLIIWDQLAGAGFTKKILPQVQLMLLQHPWSGGLAELIETMDSARILSERTSRSVVHISHMEEILKDPTAAGEYLRISEFMEASGLYKQATEQGVDRVMRQVLALMLAKSLKESFGNKRRAAELLKTPCSTFLSRARTVSVEISVCKQWV